MIKPLIDEKAKRCFTVSAWTVHEEKLLLIKHKKLGIWLAPGGHVEENELPHQAAEREFWEETGVKVQAIDVRPILSGKNSLYLPTPFAINLHEINKPNKTRGFCEQHFSLCFLVKVVDLSGFGRQLEETDDIGWFAKNDLERLETPDIKTEALWVLENFPRKKSLHKV